MKHVNDLLSDYLDGGLDAAERAAVDAHLVDCAECRGELEQLKSVLAWSKSAAKTPPPSGLEARLHARISRERTPAGRGRWWVAPGVLGTALAGYLAFLYVRAPQVTEHMIEMDRAHAPGPERFEQLPPPAPAEAEARAARAQAQAKAAERNEENRAARREAASLNGKSEATRSMAPPAPKPVPPMDELSSAPAVQPAAPMADLIGAESGASGGGGVGASNFLAAEPMAAKKAARDFTEPEPTMQSTEWRGPRCAIAKQSLLVIRSADEWRRLWRKAGLLPPAPPEINFDLHLVVAAFAGRDPQGRTIELLPAEPSGSEVTVPYRLVPGGGGETTAYDIKLLPTTPLDVRFTEETPAK
ncbi:MAG: zf-HC2 domain-containing protein [Elusimicrobia bacterium]|nr:zf-HC2 domain-containing protein [Elusimicrobiota bacterium]